MNYPNTQSPMTTNIDAYMDFKRHSYSESYNGNNSIDLQRRRTKLQETFEYIRKKFGRRKIVPYAH